MPAKASRRKFGATQKGPDIPRLPAGCGGARRASMRFARESQGKRAQIRRHADPATDICMSRCSIWAIGTDCRRPIVTLASDAAGEGRSVPAPFDVAFGRARELSQSHRDLSLRADRRRKRRLGDLHAFEAALRRPTQEAGPGLGGATQDDFKPHVTLLRDSSRAAPGAHRADFTWTVRDFVLVHSLLGKHRTHDHLARWLLRSIGGERNGSAG